MRINKKLRISYEIFGKEYINNVPAWLEMTGGDVIGGKIRVSAEKEINKLQYGSEDYKDAESKSVLELDASEGSMWPDPEPGFKVRYTTDESGL